MGYTPNALPNIWAAIATPFSITSTYAVDDYCRYDGVFYKCTTAIETAGAWDASKWTQVTVASQLGGSGSISWAPVAADYDSTATYDLGDYAIQEGKLYKANQAISTPEAFTPAHWTQVAVTDEMNNLGFVAADFDTTEGYDIGDYVIYNDELYKAKAAVSAGAWDSSKWDKVAITDVMVDNLGFIADDFSTDSTYAIGDYVIYDKELYKAKTAITTAGAWDKTNWIKVSTTDETLDYYHTIVNCFDSTKTYEIGDYVCWFDSSNKIQIYKATDVIAPGTWDVTKWKVVTLADEIKDHVIEEYDSDETYFIGECVIHDSKLYIANSNNITGTWDISKWDPEYVLNLGHDEWSEDASYVADDIVLHHGKLYRAVNPVNGEFNLTKTTAAVTQIPTATLSTDEDSFDLDDLEKPTGNLIKVTGSLAVGSDTITLTSNEFKTTDGNLYSYTDPTYDYTITFDVTAKSVTVVDDTGTNVLSAGDTFTGLQVTTPAFTVTTWAPVNDSIELAPAFDVNIQYSANDLIQYNDKIYKAKAATTKGSFIPTEWEQYYISASGGTGGADAYNLADDFDATAAYAVGDPVIKDDTLYMAKAAHAAGAWADADFEAVQVETEMLKELRAIATSLGLTRTVTWDSTNTEFKYEYSLS